MIEKMSKGKSTKEKSNIKAQALLDKIKCLSKIKKYEFEDERNRKLIIEHAEKGILKNGLFTKRTDGGAEPVWFKVSVDGKYLNGDGWYGFINPPILVPDGTKRIIKDMNNNDIETENFKEDLENVIKLLLIMVVK